MRLIQLFTSLALGLFLATPANAQKIAAVDMLDGDGVRIERRAGELGDATRVRPDDRDFIDTAMVFTNASTRTIVRCLARDDDGAPVGRAWVLLPNRGLRFILASDIAGGLDFVGSVECLTNGRVVGTALLLGPGGVTDLPSRRVHVDGPVGLAFPVVVTR